MNCLGLVNAHRSQEYVWIFREQQIMSTSEQDDHPVHEKRGLQRQDSWRVQ